MGKHRWPITGDAGEPPSRLFARPQPLSQPHVRLRPTDADGWPWSQEATSDGTVAAPQEQPSSNGEAAPPDSALWDPEGEDRPLQPNVRWHVARSAALVFLGVALAVGAALFIVRSSEPSAAAVSVQLDQEAADEPHASSAGGDGADADANPDSDADAAVGTPAGTPSEAQSGAHSGAPSGAPSRFATDASAPEMMVVYVTGAVASPGVITVAAGTRLFEVLEGSGGALPEADLEGINLAGIPTDGEHIHLLAVGEEPRAGTEAQGVPVSPSRQGSGSNQAGSATGESRQPAAVIDINVASLAEIESLPRVGPVLGQRIIDWREEHGPFAQATDIDAVPGIGPALLEGILPLIVVE